MHPEGNEVLFVTTFVEQEDNYDYWGTNIDGKIRFSYPRSYSYGLRFLKKNIPSIEILEYPTLKEYKEKLKEGWDIIGFSFFTHEMPKIKKMVKLAKKKDVDEIWGGHYGVLTPGAEEIFDRTFIGYAEKDVAEALNEEVGKIKHPYLVDLVGLPGDLNAFPIGVLFTSRGCYLNCEFCQTPKFCSEPEVVPLKSIREVISHYKRNGITEILIPEEHFGLQKKHSEKVIDILDKYDMHWYSQTSVPILDKKLDEWYERGFSGAMVGIEGLRQEQIDSVSKNIDADRTVDVIKRLEEKHAFIIGNYMIGFESDTEDNIKRSISRLADFSIDITQICILTPFPRTPLWDHIKSEYGLIEEDWSKWDTKHLVWNHPNLSQKKMHDLLRWCFKQAYPKSRFLQTPLKFYKLHSERKRFQGMGFPKINTFKKIFKDFWRSNLNLEEPPDKI